MLRKKINGFSAELCHVFVSPSLGYLRGRGGGGGGCYPQKRCVGVYGPLLKTLTFFMTKLCDIPYPIYDLAIKTKRDNDCKVDTT